MKILRSWQTLSEHSSASTEFLLRIFKSSTEGSLRRRDTVDFFGEVAELKRRASSFAPGSRIMRRSMPAWRASPKSFKSGTISDWHLALAEGGQLHVARAHVTSNTSRGEKDISLKSPKGMNSYRKYN